MSEKRLSDVDPLVTDECPGCGEHLPGFPDECPGCGAKVIFDTSWKHVHDCYWCDTRLYSWSKIVLAIKDTIHTYRNHPEELEQVADGADPRDVQVEDDG